MKDGASEGATVEPSGVVVVVMRISTVNGAPVGMTVGAEAIGAAVGAAVGNCVGVVLGAPVSTVRLPPPHTQQASEAAMRSVLSNSPRMSQLPYTRMVSDKYSQVMPGCDMLLHGRPLLE